MQEIQTNGRIIAALISGVLIYGLAMGTTYPLLGVLLSADVPAVWNGINAAATGLGLLSGVVVVPILGRQFGAGFTALSGVILMAGSLVILAIVRDFWALFAARFLLGCGANMLFVVAETALNVFAEPARRGRIMGVYSAAVAFGFVIGPAVVAVTPDTPLLLLLICAFATLCAILPLGFVRTAVDCAIRPTSVTRILPAVIAFPFAFGFLFVASAIDAVVISLLPVIALDQSYPIETGVMFVTIFHIGLLVGQPAVGIALDHFGRRQTVLGCCLVSLGSTALLFFGNRFGFWPTALLMFFWGGANFGLYTGGLALIGDRFSGAALTAATAAFAAVYAVASIISPVLAGQTIDSVGAEGFYMIIAVIYLAALLCGAAFFRPLEPIHHRA
ncbi:MFS transporter [Pelagibius sp. Alg239-R121]|uniref:MFS transporter n=1 Tax=Pelagibius sp. Alg239-R121 TaxID=2993448 RepID=UPI0024A71AA8|nr:MFS transporter [Pelagibius sp. Alg239-R121]